MADKADITVKLATTPAAKITRAAGIKGDVWVNNLLNNDAALWQLMPLYDANHTAFDLQFTYRKKGVVRCSAANITDRNQAEKLVGTQLFAEQKTAEKIPELTSMSAHQKLLDMLVVDADGQTQGNVIEVKNFGASDLLLLDNQLLIPLVDDFIGQIDEAKRRIQLTDSAQSLLDMK